MAFTSPVPNIIQQSDDGFSAEVSSQVPAPEVEKPPPFKSDIFGGAEEGLVRTVSADAPGLVRTSQVMTAGGSVGSQSSQTPRRHSSIDRWGTHLQGFGSGVSKFSSISGMAKLLGRRQSWNPSEGSPGGQSFRKHKSLKLAVDATFIRATPLTTVMQNGCSVLTPGFNKFGSAEMYQCSKEVAQIQDFISHSWRDGRWSKFVSLCLVYNGSAGLVASLIYCAIVLVVQRTVPTRLGWGTYKKVLAGETHTMHEGGCLAFVGAPIVCLAFLYNWRRIRGVWEGIPDVFLDRLCIHQTDEDLKRRGILSIGGILKHSDRMVVLWSPAYFFRLWCMFEVAVWCHLDRMDKLVLVPLSKAMLVVAGASVVYMICVITVFVHRLGHWQVSTLISFMMVLAPPAVHCLRALMRDLVALRQQLGNVSVTAAECFCCNVNHVCPETKKEIQCDRELIMNTVKELYESLGDEEGSAAERFDNVVRKDFAQRIIQNIGGPDAMPMRWCLLIVAPMIWRSTDIISARGLPPEAIMRLVLTQFNFVLDILLVVRVWFFIWGYLANSRGLFVVDYAVSCLGAWACLMLATGFWAKTYFASQLPMAWPLVVNIFMCSMLNLAIYWGEFAPSGDRRHHIVGTRSRRSRTSGRYKGHSGGRHSTTSTGGKFPEFDKLEERCGADNEESNQCQPCSKVHPSAGLTSAGPPSLPAWTPPSGEAGKPEDEPASPRSASPRSPIITSWEAAKDTQAKATASAARSSWFSSGSASLTSGTGSLQ